MVGKPTKRQAKVIRFIWEFQRKKGFPPSITEIKEGMDVESFQSVLDMLNRLVQDGWILRKERRARSVRVSEKSLEFLADLGSTALKLELPTIVSYKGQAIPGSSGTQNPGTIIGDGHAFSNTANNLVYDILKNSSGETTKLFVRLMEYGIESGFCFFAILLFLRQFIPIDFGEMLTIVILVMAFLSLKKGDFNVFNH